VGHAERRAIEISRADAPLFLATRHGGRVPPVPQNDRLRLLFSFLGILRDLRGLIESIPVFR